MGLTDFSDLFTSVHEDAFNNIVVQLQKQRPSIFNYGTHLFAQRPDMLCQRIVGFIDEDVHNFSNPLIHELDLLRVPGYEGDYGLEYCMQLSQLSIDFFPGNVHSLPPELKPLKEQHFSLKARLCVGLGCPELRVIESVAPTERAWFPVVDIPGVVEQPGLKKNASDHRNARTSDNKKPLLPPTHPFPFYKPICCCLDLYVIFHLSREGSAIDPILALKLDNLEIVDIKPEDLENIVECFIKTTLILSVLPKVKLALRALIFNIEKLITIEPTPVPAGVPNNPAIEDDQIKVFINVNV